MRAGHDPPRSLGVVREQVEALVGREPPREPECQRVRVEQRLDRADVVDLLAAQQPVLLVLLADVLDEAAGAPRDRAAQSSLVRDRAHRLPRRPGRPRASARRRRGSGRRAPHRRRRERRQVHAVRDVGDRDVVVARPANIGCHIPRATSPWSAADAVAARLMRIASGVIPGGSSGVAGWTRHRPRNASSSIPSRPARSPNAARNSPGCRSRCRRRPACGS